MRPAILVLFVAATAHSQRFYPDDPLEFEPPPKPVTEAKNRKLSDYFDLLSHQFGRTGERQPRQGPPIRARSVNTIGEPLQGAWWVKRHYYHRMSIDELKRSPAPGDLPSRAGKWTVISAKTEGVTPGFVILDATKKRFFIKFDPLTNPEMATAADAITSRLFHAMGFHVPVNNIVHFSPDDLRLGEDIEINGRNGKPRKMTRTDLTEILLKVPKAKDGRYRATASLAVPGKPIGPPRYYGTRADDPNDVVPHEHRRDQRALHVIDAWLAHDDSRAINNLDAIVTEHGVPHIRHFHLDFGSTLGSGTQRANSPRSGAYYFAWKASARQLFSFGLAPPYWALARYPDFPSLGMIEWKRFDPERWVPEYPNPAFLNRLPDDEFWGAKLVSAFSDDELRAIVAMGQYSDKKAEEWLLECLIQRRDRIARTYFAKLLPFDNFVVVDGEVKWENLGKLRNYAIDPEVTFQWSAFDNASEARQPLPGADSPRLPALADGYSCLTIQSKAQPARKIDVFVRRAGQTATVAAIDRYW